MTAAVRITDGSGTLTDGQPHPAAYDAKAWLADHLGSDPVRTTLLVESFASVALSGDASAEVCSETLRRLLRGEPVSNRYLLGLAWTIRAIEDAA
jgi:hypothetical protein